MTTSQPAHRTNGRRPAPRGGVVGIGAAACAVCCAAPLLTLLGIGLTGAAATAFTVAFAGVVFGVVVAAATVGTVLVRRRQARRDRCSPTGPTAVGPVPVQLLIGRPDRPHPQGGGSEA